MMNNAPLKVLFLCTGNAARSQIAEALLNHKAHGRIVAYSASSDPAAEINPYAVNAMRDIGLDISGKKPKSQTLFAEEYFDFIITLCDRALDQCPVVPSPSIHVHWGFADPKYFTGTEEELLKQVKAISVEIARRLDLFLSLPLDSSDRDALKKKLNEIVAIRE